MSMKQPAVDLFESLLDTRLLDTFSDRGDQYLNCGLSEYLFDLLNDRGIKRSRLIHDTGINGSQIYDIFKGKSKPGRDTAIMLAFGLHCSLLQTQRLLRLSGVAALWPEIRRDAIIIWCLDKGLARNECDDKLWQLGERTLFGTDESCR